MNPTLNDKIALITGASRGIGRAIATALAKEGVHVILTARDNQLLTQLAEEINSSGGQATALAADLQDESAIESLAATIQSRCNRLDILINNAGTSFNGPLEKTSTAQWDHCMAVNARAAFILTRQTLPLLEQARPGFIINISSVVGFKGYAQQIAYSASKHALRGMTIALAEELRGRDIRVHVICPGGVATEMVQQMRPDINMDELITPEEIADCVLNLLTHRGNGMIDEIRIRRRTAAPWF